MVWGEGGGVVERLAVLGCALGDPIRQEDSVYVEHAGDLDTFLSNEAFLRIRVNDGAKVVFTVKKRTGALVAIEHEVTVDSREELEQILLLVGYQKTLDIKKTRRITHYNGCEICLDEVEGLGSFIEMEKLSRDGDPGHIQEELFRFLESVGITREDRVTKGYDILLFEKAR